MSINEQKIKATIPLTRTPTLIFFFKYRERPLGTFHPFTTQDNYMDYQTIFMVKGSPW